MLFICIFISICVIICLKFLGDDYLKNKLNKIIVLLLSTIFIIFSTACEAKTDPNVDSLVNIKNNKVLRIATEATYPPMEFLDMDGNVVGFEIDMSKAIAERIGVKLEIINTDFAGITEGLKSNRYDVVIATMNITPEREKSVLFSKAYIDEVGLSIVTRSKDTSINDFNNLSDKTIGIQQGSVAESFVEGKSFKDVKKYVRIADSFTDLKAGRIDAVVSDNVVGAYYMSKDQVNFRMVDKLLDAGPVGIAMKTNSPELKIEIDKILSDMKADGTLSEISLKWFGKDIYK